jgi:hypothetical protein
MRPSGRQFLRLAAGAVALPALARVADAQTFPSRPITMVGRAARAAPDGYTLSIGHWTTHVPAPVVI